MPRALLITVRFLHGRYHGTGDWPPAPARLFQSLVAGAAAGSEIDGREALAWLEGLDAPLIAAPRSSRGQRVRNYVPNNDLDAKGGDPARIAEIRTPKLSQPHLFDADIPFVYLWPASDDRWNEAHADAIVGLAERMYQLGRGIDPAFAEAEIIDGGEAEARLAAYPGSVHRPATGGSEKALSCPAPGSLESLAARFAADRRRFASERVGRTTVTRFTRPPRPSFRGVAYDAPPARLSFEIRDSVTDAFRARPLTETVRLVERVRDGAIERFGETLEREADALGSGIGEAEIRRYLKGAKDSSEADKARRVRIIPLPSIGHVHADPDIRRILVEIPQQCPIGAATMAWALNGLPLTPGHDEETGEIFDHARLVPAEARSMLGHYGIEGDQTARRWRTVTPAALPAAPRRRIDPTRRREDAKGGTERAEEEARAARAVLRALRHAGVKERPSHVRVQREPWGLRGERAESFAAGTRFAKHALWHVELVFPEPRGGPLIVGDGRWLGLGLMAPQEAPRDVFAFDLDPATAPPANARAAFLAAVRRALMSRAKDGRGKVPRLLSGHEEEGGPARSGSHDHVFLSATRAGDRLDRLYVVAPWRGDRTREERPGERHRLETLLLGFHHVRAGRLGVVALAPPRAPEADDPLCGRGKVWESLTPYAPTRHSKGADLRAALATDIARECHRRGLPRAEVEILGEPSAGPRGGLRARARLRFAVAVTGPILLGRNSHSGGGAFALVR